MKSGKQKLRDNKMIRFAAVLAFLTGVVLSIRSAPAATPPESFGLKDSYIFASPNTRPELAGGNAGQHLKSFEELNAISVADRIACSFTHSAGISSTLGVFNGQTENSFVVETDLVRERIEYIASLLGKFGHQEFVLWFIPRSSGHDRLWTIHAPTHDSKDVIVAMQQLYVNGATIRNAPATTEIWIADFGGKLQSAPDALAAKLGGKATWEAGVAQLFGNDDRSKAAGLFKKKIDAFELDTNTRLSSRFESPPWKKATTRTCSSEVPNVQPASPSIDKICVLQLTEEVIG